MIHSKKQLLQTVDAVLDFTRALEDELQLSLEILDFGGSLATTTVHNIASFDKRLGRTFHREPPAPNADGSLRIEEYVECLIGRVNESYKQRGRPVPRIFIEPGRGMTGNTQMLLASVITIKQTREADYLFLDAGINLAESVRNEYHHLFAVRDSSSTKRLYTIVGPICTPGDTLYPAWRGPDLLDGDQVVIMDAGAYFVPFSTSFSFPRPPIIMLDHGNATLFRRAECFEDMIAYDQMLG
jgi:diaminopimelate decarboxylase